MRYLGCLIAFPVAASAQTETATACDHNGLQTYGYFDYDSCVAAYTNPTDVVAYTHAEDSADVSNPNSDTGSVIIETDVYYNTNGAPESGTSYSTSQCNNSFYSTSIESGQYTTCSHAVLGNNTYYWQGWGLAYWSYQLPPIVYSKSGCVKRQ